MGVNLASLRCSQAASAAHFRLMPALAHTRPECVRCSCFLYPTDPCLLGADIETEPATETGRDGQKACPSCPFPWLILSESWHSVYHRLYLPSSWRATHCAPNTVFFDFATIPDSDITLASPSYAAAAIKLSYIMNSPTQHIRPLSRSPHLRVLHTNPADTTQA